MDVVVVLVVVKVGYYKLCLSSSSDSRLLQVGLE